MIKYYTAAHEPPPRTVEIDGQQWPVQRLIQADDAEALAPLGIYRHEWIGTPTIPGEWGEWQETTDARGTKFVRYAVRRVTVAGDAPLGYTDWTLKTDAEGDYWEREPAGTEAERDAAALQQQREKMRITRLQARLLLLQTPDPSATFASAWEAVIAWATTQDAQTQAFWEDAQSWDRTNPYVLAGATAFGWDDATLDQLFAAGAQL